MDPDATLKLLIDALHTGDTEAAREHCESLTYWLARQGYSPTLDRDQLVNLIHGIGLAVHAI